MILVDRGLISLEDAAIDYLPEFTGDDRPAIKVRHLLSHISGMPDMLPENVSLRRGARAGRGLCRAVAQDAAALQTRDRFPLPEQGHPAGSRNHRARQRPAATRL